MDALLVRVPSVETEREIWSGDVVGVCKTGWGTGVEGPSAGSCGPNIASARSLCRLVGLSTDSEIAGDSGKSWPWDCIEDCGVSKAGRIRGDSIASITESKRAFAFSFWVWVWSASTFISTTVVVVVTVVVEPVAETDDSTFAAEGDADLVCAGEGLPTFKGHF